MGGYSSEEVARLVGVTPSRLRGYVRSGLLSPERGTRGELRFSFQDLRLLRAAEGLITDRIPPRRVRQALKRLREQLPDTRPLSGVQLASEGRHIVVEDAGRRWHPDSGQVLLDFTGDGRTATEALPAPTSLQERRQRPAEPETAPSPRPHLVPLDAEELYQIGCDLEGTDPAHAEHCYRQALALVPDHPDANVNLGRLLHEAGKPAEAELHYRRALAARPIDAIAAFNLGVALEDQGRTDDALAEYEHAVALDARSADAHYNAARLCEARGDYAAAVRHLRAYRRLTNGGRPRR